MSASRHCWMWNGSSAGWRSCVGRMGCRDSDGVASWGEAPSAEIEGVGPAAESVRLIGSRPARAIKHGNLAVHCLPAGKPPRERCRALGRLPGPGSYWMVGPRRLCSWSAPLSPAARCSPRRRCWSSRAWSAFAGPVLTTGFRLDPARPGGWRDRAPAHPWCRSCPARPAALASTPRRCPVSFAWSAPSRRRLCPAGGVAPATRPNPRYLLAARS